MSSHSAVSSDILFLAFNQDATSLAVGTKKGYALYYLDKVDELRKLHESELDNVCLIERLFSSCLVTVVSQLSPRKLRVYHFQKGTEICNHSYSNTVLSVRLNRLRLVVCLEENLYIHNIRDMKVLHTIRDTPANPQGLCELSPADNSYLAYPGSSTSGEVHIFDASSLEAKTAISAHDGVLAAMKFNFDGTRLATASEKGTVIRVFEIPSGEKLFELRRGMKRNVTIYSLAFSPDSNFLCSSSNTETIHIFKLEHEKDANKPESSNSDQSTPYPPAPTPSSVGHGWFDYVSKTAAAYLPTQVSDMLAQDRAFASAHLPQYGTRNACALTVIDKITRLLVASTDGSLYVYNYDQQQGGECALVRQHRLLDAGGVKQVSQPVNVPLSPGTGGNPGLVPTPANTTYASTVSKKPEPAKRESRGHRADAAAGVAGLKLDDSGEFPPMSHQVE